jgi:hypothetical protein
MTTMYTTERTKNVGRNVIVASPLGEPRGAARMTGRAPSPRHSHPDSATRQVDLATFRRPAESFAALDGPRRPGSGPFPSDPTRSSGTARAVSSPSVSVLHAATKPTTPRSKIAALAALVAVVLCGLGLCALRIDVPRKSVSTAAPRSLAQPAPEVRAPLAVPSTPSPSASAAPSPFKASAAGPVKPIRGATTGVATAGAVHPAATERMIAESIVAGDYARASEACDALSAAHPDEPRYAIMMHVLRTKAAKAQSAKK